MVGRSDIGRYDAVSFGFFPGFNIIFTSATFHDWGTYFSRNEAFIMFVNFTNAIFGNRFKTWPVIKSYPGAFLGLMFFFISFLTSVTVTGCISFPTVGAVFMFSRLSPCSGVKIVSRCSAKRFAFSISVLAQVPFAFLIGGIDCIGFLNCLLAFHNE
jgi:hypothetical protein